MPFSVSATVSKTEKRDENGQNKYSSKIIKQGYFDKKRLSDNVFEDKQQQYRMDEDAIKEIFDKKEKTRKGHNVSVTTNTSTASNNTQNKKASTNYAG